MNGEPAGASAIAGAARVGRGGVAAFAIVSAVSIGFAAMLITREGRWSLLPFAMGVFGWMLAMGLRVPVALVARKRGSKSMIVAASGPAEESVRLAAVLLFASTSWHAGLIGFGWAAIEVVHATVIGLALVRLTNATDEKAAEALKQMRSLGMDRAWGLVDGLLERAAASSFHVAASLALFQVPTLVFLLVPLHSLANMQILASLRLSHARYRLSLVVMLTFAVTAALVAVRYG